MRRAVVLAVAVLAGCALKAPPTHTDVVEQALATQTRIPPAWRADPRGGDVMNGWLKSFDDPTLEALVAEAIANNLDLRAAAAKVAIAQQTVIVVGFDLDEAQGLFESCAIAARNSNPLNVENEESRDHPDILVCRNLKMSWPKYWATHRRFG